MSDGAIISLIVVIFVVFLGIGLFAARFMNGWLLLVVMVVMAWLGHMWGEDLSRGNAFSSLGSAIFFIGFVLPGVFGFGIGAFITKARNGGATE